MRVYYVKPVRQGASAEKDSLEKVLKAKMSLNWTRPWEILGIEQSVTALDDRPVGEKLLYFAFLTDEAGPLPQNRVSALRCKPCTALHDTTHMPKQVPLGLSHYE